MFYLALKASFVLSVLYLTLVAIQRWVLWSKLPPGPKGYPFIGNLLSIIRGDLRNTGGFTGKYAHLGALTCTTALGRVIMTVQTHDLAVELFEKKGSIYSSRPTLPVQAAAGFQDTISLLPYGPKIREARAWLHGELGRKNVGEYAEVQEQTARRFVKFLLNEPGKFFERIDWYTASVIVKVIYGHDSADDGDDTMLTTPKKVNKDFETACLYGFLTPLIPLSRYLPDVFPLLGGADKFVRQFAREYADMRDGPFEAIRSAMKTNTEPNCFTSRWLRTDMSLQQRKLLSETAVVCYAAGVDSSSTVLKTFFFRMQQYPDIQRAAQKELDRVIGHDNSRLPVFKDRAELPYVDALVKELLRHCPPALRGIPHQATEDGVHGGYFIPKGSLLYGNIGGMARDPTVHKDPDVFDPSRFLGGSPEMDPYDYVFGFGRRTCPGMWLADGTLFIAVAMILSTFDITPGDSKHLDVIQVITQRVLPYSCSLTPRNQLAKEDLSFD